LTLIIWANILAITLTKPQVVRPPLKTCYPRSNQPLLPQDGFLRISRHVIIMYPLPISAFFAWHEKLEISNFHPYITQQLILLLHVRIPLLVEERLICICSIPLPQLQNLPHPLVDHPWLFGNFTPTVHNSRSRFCHPIASKTTPYNPNR
jgi:hypothetical protein